MKTTIVMALVALTGVAASVELPSLRGAETPRATDLLRAERLEERVKKRLQPPPRRGPAWRHGGSGWDDPSGAAAEPRESVIIRVQPPRRRRPRP